MPILGLSIVLKCKANEYPGNKQEEPNWQQSKAFLAEFLANAGGVGEVFTPGSFLLCASFRSDRKQLMFSEGTNVP